MQRFERSVDTAAVDVIASQSDRHARKRTPETRGGRLRDVLWIAAAAAILQASVLQVSVVRGTSMEPTLCDGDRLVVDRIARGIGGLEHGDVVVLRNPVESGIDFVKRVVALPGDRVALRGGRLLVNGAEAERFEHVPDDCDMPELVVPADHVFVLGDNRPVSADSRDFGIVPGPLLLGTVRARVWPPARAALL